MPDESVGEMVGRLRGELTEEDLAKLPSDLARVPPLLECPDAGVRRPHYGRVEEATGVKTHECLWLKCRCGYSRSIPCHHDETISAVAERKRWRFTEGHWQCPTCWEKEETCALSAAG